MTLAGVLEIIWLNFFLRREGVNISLVYDLPGLFKSEDIRVLFKRIAPGVLGAGVYQINMMVDTILVSLVGTGAISWLYYANRLQQLPLGVVGAAIGVALLPILSRQLKAGDDGEAKKRRIRRSNTGCCCRCRRRQPSSFWPSRSSIFCFSTGNSGFLKPK